MVSPQFHCVYDDYFETPKFDRNVNSLWQNLSKLDAENPIDGCNPDPQLFPTFDLDHEDSSIKIPEPEGEDGKTASHSADDELLELRDEPLFYEDDDDDDYEPAQPSQPHQAIENQGPNQQGPDAPEGNAQQPEAHKINKHQMLGNPSHRISKKHPHQAQSVFKDKLHSENSKMRQQDRTNLTRKMLFKARTTPKP